MQREFLEISPGGSEVVFKETLNLYGTMFRIEITSGMSRESCEAHAFIFNKSELKWTEIASIHYGSMETKHCLSCERSAWVAEDNFKLDRDYLAKQVTRLLGGRDEKTVH
jgi:hypothetical protein